MLSTESSSCINRPLLYRLAVLDSSILIEENATESELYDRASVHMTLTLVPNKMLLKSIDIAIAFLSVAQLTNSVEYVLFNGRRTGRFGILLKIINANTASILCAGDLLYFDNFNNYACWKLGHGPTFVSPNVSRRLT